MNRAPVVVHIDALDLTAVAASRRPAVAAAFVRELQILLRTRPETWSPCSPNAGDAPAPLAVRLDAPPHRVGAALAHSVYQRLGSEGAT